MTSFARWREQLDHLPHTELAEIVLEESGYTEMWQQDRSADAPGRLENLKELVRSMEEFDTLTGFLEHVSLVMDADAEGSNDAVNIMTLHSAKGLEFDIVFLPGWEEGLFPSQRTLDENGRAGLEEERRLAYVGITRARKRAYIRFAANRRMHGLWQSSIPSRFLDELPEDHVEVAEETGSYGGYGQGSYGASRFDTRDPFANTYGTPGWQRAQKNRERAGGKANGKRGFDNPLASGPRQIEGELVAKSVIGGTSDYAVGERVFHQKFGYGRIASIDGNKLTIDFEKAGQKRVLELVRRAALATHRQPRRAVFVDHHVGELGDGGLARRLVEGDDAARDQIDAIAHVEDLGVVVGDDDHRDLAGFLQPLDEVEDQRRLLGAHRRRRLVEQQHPRLLVDRAGDRDRLPLAAGERGHLSIDRRDADAHAIEVLLRPPPHLPVVEDAEDATPDRLALQEHVVEDVELVDQREVLVDRLDAERARMADRAKLDRLCRRNKAGRRSAGDSR